MAYYQELDDILNIVIGKYILNNQNICKLLYYYPETNELNYNPLNEKDIEDTSILLLDYIYPMPKSPNIETKQKGFMTVVLTGSDYPLSNSGFRKVNLVFDIIFHLKSWIIEGSYRPYKIAEEIDKIFNNTILDLPIYNKPLSYPFSTRDYSGSYYGLQLIYELTLNSNIDCISMPKNINIKNKKEQELSTDNLDINKPIFLSKVLGNNKNEI